MNIIPGMKLRSRCFRYRYYNTSLCMHPANVTSSASYRAWRIITFLTTFSRILWPAFGRPWPAPHIGFLLTSQRVHHILDLFPHHLVATSERDFPSRFHELDIAENCFPRKTFPGTLSYECRATRFYTDPKIDATTISVINIVNYYEILKRLSRFLYISILLAIYFFLIQIHATWFKSRILNNMILLMCINIIHRYFQK